MDFGLSLVIAIAVPALAGYVADLVEQYLKNRKAQEAIEEAQGKATFEKIDSVARTEEPPQPKKTTTPTKPPPPPLPPLDIKVFQPLQTLAESIKQAAKYQTNLTDRSERMETFREFYSLPQKAKFAIKLGISFYIPQGVRIGKEVSEQNTVIGILYNDFFVNSVTINASEYIQAIQSYDDMYFIFHGHSTEGITLSGYMVEPASPEISGQFALFDHLYYSILSGTSLNELMKAYSSEDPTKQLLASVTLFLGKKVITGALANFSVGTHSGSQHVYSFTFTFVPSAMVRPALALQVPVLSLILNSDSKMVDGKTAELLKEMLRKLLKLDGFNLEGDEVKGFS